MLRCNALQNRESETHVENLNQKLFQSLSDVLHHQRPSVDILSLVPIPRKHSDVLGVLKQDSGMQIFPTVVFYNSNNHHPFCQYCPSRTPTSDMTMKIIRQLSTTSEDDNSV